MGISSTFPGFPERKIEVGDFWRLPSIAPEIEYEGFGELLGFEQVEGRPCARMQIRSTMPATMPQELDRDLARQGLSIQGAVRSDMTQFFDLVTGWPVSGNGKTTYEVTVLRNEEKLSHTTYDFDVDFAADFGH